MTKIHDSIANFPVSTVETDLFTPMVDDANYNGIYIFLHNIGSNDIIIRFFIWDAVGAAYRQIDKYTQTGTDANGDEAHFFPLLPHRRFKVTVRRTIGTNFNINADIVTQPS